MGKHFLGDFFKSLDQMEKEICGLCGGLKHSHNHPKHNCNQPIKHHHCKGTPGFPPPPDFRPPCGRERCCCQRVCCNEKESSFK